VAATISFIIYVICCIIATVYVEMSIVKDEFTRQERKFIIDLLNITQFGFLTALVPFFGLIPSFISAFWIFNSKKWQPIVEKSELMKRYRALVILVWVSTLIFDLSLILIMNFAPQRQSQGLNEV